MENLERGMQNEFVQRTNDLLDRTRKFALASIKFCESVPKDDTSRILARQLLRSGTSVGANYRAAHRAKSKADFISKMGTVLEEADESSYWIELLTEAGKTVASKSAALHGEANELVAIAVSSINTARRNPDLQG
jgi:four helix bundle protein